MNFETEKFQSGLDDRKLYTGKVQSRSEANSVVSLDLITEICTNNSRYRLKAVFGDFLRIVLKYLITLYWISLGTASGRSISFENFFEERRLTISVVCGGLKTSNENRGNFVRDQTIAARGVRFLFHLIFSSLDFRFSRFTVNNKLTRDIGKEHDGPIVLSAVKKKKRKRIP